MHGVMLLASFTLGEGELESAQQSDGREVDLVLNAFDRKVADGCRLKAGQVEVAVDRCLGTVNAPSDDSLLFSVGV